MLNKENLAIAKLACKEESRFTIQGILVTPKECVVTDGHQLTRVTTPAMDPDQFPICPYIDGMATRDFKPFLLPARDALDMIKNLPKNGKVLPPILSHAAVIGQDLDEEGKPTVTRMMVTDMEHWRPYLIKMEGNFPDFERIMPKRSNNIFEIAMGAELLTNVLTRAKDFLSESRGGMVILSFEGPDKPIQVISRVDGQEMTQVVMPLHTRSAPLENANFEMREKAVEALRVFYEGLKEFDELEEQMKAFEREVVPVGAVLFGKARHLFKEPEAEPVSEAEKYPEVGEDNEAPQAEVGSPSRLFVGGHWRDEQEWPRTPESDHPVPVLAVKNFGLSGSLGADYLNLAGVAFDTDGNKLAKAEMWRDADDGEVHIRVKAVKTYPGDKHQLREWVKFLAIREYDRIVNGAAVASEEVASDEEANKRAEEIRAAKHDLKAKLEALRRPDDAGMLPTEAALDGYRQKLGRRLGRSVVDQLLAELQEEQGEKPVDPTPSVGGSFTARIKEVQAIAEAETIIDELEEKVGEIEAQAGLKPLVGPFGLYGLRTISPLQRETMREAVRNKSPELYDKLEQLLAESQHMFAAYDTLFNRVAEERRKQFGIVPPKTPVSGSRDYSVRNGIGSTPDLSSDQRPEKPADWNTWGAGKKAAWTRKVNQRYGLDPKAYGTV